MITECAALAKSSGVIVDAMNAVECHSRTYAQSGYEALGGAGSPFQTWLNVLLVIYVALLGYRMMLGTQLRPFNLTSIGLTVGAILALVGNWTLFQTLVFDLVTRAPIQIAGLITHPDTNPSAFAADPRASLQVLYDQLALAARAFSKMAGPNAPAYAGGAAGAAQALWQSAQGLFFATAGVFSLGVITAAVLTAIGPILIALSLFEATRGVFAGWIRGLLASLFVSLLGWLSVSLMLSIIEPSLIELARQRLDGELQVDTALTVSALVMLFGFVQVGVAAAGVMMAMAFRWPLGGIVGGMPAKRPSDGSETPRDNDGYRGGVSRADQLAASLRYPPPVASSEGILPISSGRAANARDKTWTDLAQRTSSSSGRRPGRLPGQDRVRP